MSRVPSGIPGLDDMLTDGFISGDIVLVTGSPGSGKTTLGLQYLYHGATEHGEPGIFVTLEESPARVIRNAWQFGWDLERLVKENVMRVIHADPVAYAHYIPTRDSDDDMHLDVGARIVETLSKHIEHRVSEIGAKRVFIDSITSLKISQARFQARFAIMELIKNLENLGCTTMLSSEITSGALAYESFSVEEYLSEVVIRMHVVRVAGGRIRAIEILKMRGGKHDDMLRPYAILDTGLVIYPRETVIDSDAINAVTMM